MSEHEAIWWKAEVFNSDLRWTNGSEVPRQLPGSSLPIILAGPAELSLEAEWFEHLQPRARTLSPAFVIGNWRYEQMREPLVNFGPTEMMERQSFSAKIILPAGNHNIHFEARMQYIGAPMGVISIAEESPFRMAVKVVRRLK